MFLPFVVVAHALRVAHQLDVVDRHRLLVGEPARGLRRVDAPAGPLTVVCHEQQRGLGHRGARLDETLDTATRPDELRKMLETGTIRLPIGRATRLPAPAEPGHRALLTFVPGKSTCRPHVVGYLSALIGSPSDKMAWTTVTVSFS